MNKTTSYVNCVPIDATTVERLIVDLFGWWPRFVFGFGAVVLLFDQSVYMVMTTLLILVCFGYYLEVVAEALAVARSPSFDSVFCEASPHAFPDAVFVPVMLYTCVVILGVYYNKALHIRVGAARALFILAQIAGYLATTLISTYFTPALLAANSLLVIALTVTFFYLFEKISDLVWTDALNRNDVGFLQSVAALLGARLGDESRHSLRGS
jgi:hypothetical protein